MRDVVAWGEELRIIIGEFARVAVSGSKYGGCSAPTSAEHTSVKRWRRT
jgi:hypothetical protein